MCAILVGESGIYLAPSNVSSGVRSSMALHQRGHQRGHTRLVWLRDWEREMRVRSGNERLEVLITGGGSSMVHSGGAQYF